ncbi:hypothetical protein JCM8547_008261 [Rhodosporidiobolus lusitaniae]
MSHRPPDSSRDPSARSPSPPSSRTASRRRSSAHATASSSSSSSTPASLGVAGGRRPSGSLAARRSSRRASLDPYPSAGGAGGSRGGSSEMAGEATPLEGAVRIPTTGGWARRASGSRTQSHETVQEEGADEGAQMEVERREEATGFPPSAASDMNFRLVMMQQPEIGAETGLAKNTLGRLPIVPAPVVELIVQDQRGERVDREFPFLFCSCSLRQADGISPVEIAPPKTGDTEADEEFSALVGGIVRQSHRIEDLEGNQRDVFVFEDVSVRPRGNYTLEFTLGEAIRPKSPKLAAVRSDQFDVVEWENYPGRPVADTIPELSLHLRKQGVPMYIPPLLLSSESAPPPASSNPFPSGAVYGSLDEVKTPPADPPANH